MWDGLYGLLHSRLYIGVRDLEFKDIPSTNKPKLLKVQPLQKLLYPQKNLTILNKKVKLNYLFENIYIMAVLFYSS